MRVSVSRLLTHRFAGPIATSAALALAVALGATWAAGQRTEAQLLRRVAALDRQLNIAIATQKAQAASCASSQQALRVAASRPRDAAERLLRRPEGFDVCARMESADQAVLESLG